jgi:hypothetical protein
MAFEPGDSDELDFAMDVVGESVGNPEPTMAVLRRLRDAAREEGC